MRKGQITKILRRRIDSGEPIEDIRSWFLEQKQIWEGYFADQDPLVQWFIVAGREAEGLVLTCSRCGKQDRRGLRDFGRQHPARLRQAARRLPGEG
jgi:hypothetical protein